MISLLFAVMLLVILGQKLRIAYPIFLVIGGLLISLIPGAPQSTLSPDLIFLIFLPPLLYEAAWYTSWPNFWKMRLPIALHGFGLVILTSVVVAVVSEKLIPQFTLTVGLLLGGVISPPDAVAATSVLKFFKVPRKVKTVLEGESLVNDAASLTVFRFALAAVITGHFVLRDAAVSFVWVTVMGILFGLLIGQVIYFIYKLFHTTAEVSTALTLVTPYIMYLTAEHFHFSGVLSVVSGGLFLSSRSKEILNYKARLQSHGVWTTIGFVLNGLVFILIGLQLPYIINGLKYYTLSQAILYGLIISVLIILIRLIWFFVASYVPYMLNKRMDEKLPRPDPREVLVAGWAGMRGVISLASALSIPVSLADGRDFPERDLVLFISFMVILVTLVFQGLTLPWLIRRLKLSEDKLETSAEIQSLQVHRFILKLSIDRLEQNHAHLIRKNVLVKNYCDRMKLDTGMTEVSIEAMIEHVDEKELLKEFHDVVLDISDYVHRQLTSLRLNEEYDEDVIRMEEARIDLEQNKIFYD